MHQKDFTKKLELTVLAGIAVVGLFVFGVFGFRKSRACGSTDIYRFDRYSGETVRDADHAAAIMMLRHVNAPLVGETAPNSEMIQAKTGRKVNLNSILREKPLVLIFGSASCSNLDSYRQDISNFCARYGDTVDFAFVYLREAHPEGGFMPNLSRDGVDIMIPPLPDPKTIKERRNSALTLKKETSEQLQVFVDSIDDEMAVRWGAWPDRIFVIGPDRKLMYSGGPGPFHFRFSKAGWHSQPPEQMNRAFLSMPFSRISLEEFLDSLVKP